MEAYYSSDDDVSWGPLTIREIKSHLNRPVLRKPDRRHTLHSEQTIEYNKMSNALSEDSILEISAYLTASEAASVKQDTDYYSTEENSIKVPPNKSTQINHVKSSLGFNEKDTSCFDFVHNAMAKPSDVFIKNEYVTLIESPNNSLNQTNSDIIEISSDDETELKKKANLSCVLEISDISDENTSYTEKDCSRQEELCEIESYCKYSDDSLLDHSEVDISGIKLTTCNSNENIDEYVCEIDATNESKCPSSSAVTIPEIDLQQFNDSSVYSFNDTLERINAILNQDKEQSLTESSNVETTNSKVNKEEEKTSPICKKSPKRSEDYSQSCNLISGSFIQKPLSDLPSKKPSTNYQTPKNHFVVKSHIPLPKRSPDSFKVPTLPLKSKPNLKDIVSPVRMYIKYSPKPVLKRNVDPIATKLYQKPKNSSKENGSDIPSNVIYKPSKKPVLGSEKAISLPKSLNKLVIKSTVTKHERNPVSVKTDVSLNSECELTKNSLNESQFSDQNMSVLHKKPAYGK
ncbi:uncharacterized protein LOC130448485 [Diorhabda sublineata]|uniref:uncharacterized protein LOC130448485 n=1 Tax=Diorhabda sublineata TaxID=1163346 RepID=UPI0024E06E6C|nr:uncharacterized protein LOC130448485 [Diorhabda sublineata]